MKKSISLDNSILSDGGIPIAFFNAKISVGYENLNISINVIDEKTLSTNIDLFKKQFESFIDSVKTEAMNNGWDALKATESIETPVV